MPNAKKMEEIDDMVDRTFDANDVLRIFAEHLDEREQETVREFFQEPADINLAILERLLRILLEFVQLYTSPLVGLIVSLLPQVTIDVYNESIVLLLKTNRGISREIGRIDA